MNRGLDILLYVGSKLIVYSFAGLMAFMFINIALYYNVHVGIFTGLLMLVLLTFFLYDDYKEVIKLNKEKQKEYMRW